MNKHILVILNKHLSEDPRAFREINALLASNFCIDVISPKKNISINSGKKLKFFYAPIVKKRSSKFRYIFEYIIYFFYIMFLTPFLNTINHYSVIQVFVMPEILMFCCIIPKFLGSKILMDWMDPSLDVYVSKFIRKKVDICYWLLKKIELLSYKIADKIIVPNLGFKRAFMKRNLDVSKIEIIPNSADESIFNTKKSKDNLSKNFNLLFHGFIVSYNGLDVAIEAISYAKKYISCLKLTVIGDGPDMSNSIKKAKNLGLAKHIKFIGRLQLSNTVPFIKEADVGIVSNRNTPFTEINLPTRIMELICMKKVVICSDLPGIRDYFDDSAIMFFKPGDSEGLAQCIIELYENKEKRFFLVKNALKQYQNIKWEKTKKNFLNIIENMY